MATTSKKLVKTKRVGKTLNKKKDKKNKGISKKEKKRENTITYVKVDEKLFKEVLEDNNFKEYLKEHVGPRSIEILNVIRRGLKTDEEIATEINEKINEVRRELNIMNGMNLLNYITKKSSSGWLTFKWYLDQKKLESFYNSINKSENNVLRTLPDNCNDFFICKNCYPKNKAIIPFDKAFDLSFKCPECGRSLDRIDKENLINFITQFEINNK